MLKFSSLSVCRSADHHLFVMPETLVMICTPRPSDPQRLASPSVAQKAFRGQNSMPGDGNAENCVHSTGLMPSEPTERETRVLFRDLLAPAELAVVGVQECPSH